MKKIAGTLIALIAWAGSAAAVTFPVSAYLNSYNMGGLGEGPETFYNTGLYVSSGQGLNIVTNPGSIWYYGVSWGYSNADGVTGYYYGSYPMNQFQIGALVGRIGAGPYFNVGTNYNNPLVANSGVLYLGYWDINHVDNGGVVEADVHLYDNGLTGAPLPGVGITFGMTSLLSALGVLKRRRTA